MSVRSLGLVVPENTIRFLGHGTHEHDVPHLVYVATGGAVVMADGEELRLRRHEAVWLAPHVPHAVQVSEGGMVLGPLLEPHAVPRSRVRPLGVVPALVDVMTTTLGAAPATPEQVAPFRAALSDIVTRLGRQYFSVRMPVHPVARAVARDALRAPWTLEQLARRHRMSTRQIQRVFLDETGVPFARWRSRARMNAAISHLVGGGDLTAAARMAGYATRAGLVRALSRETGVRPEEIALDAAGALATSEAVR